MVQSTTVYQFHDLGSVMYFVAEIVFDQEVIHDYARVICNREIVHKSMASFSRPARLHSFRSTG